MNTATSVEMQMLFCAIALGIVQLLLAVLASVGARGMPWAMGTRDDAGTSLGKFGGRIERAWRNFLETFPFFAAAVLLAHALGKHTDKSALGAQIYVGARAAYVFVYVLGIPLLRTLVWIASLVGILMVLSAIWPG
jgi:uncharacterized MAPEG superfamily protein